MIRKNYRKHTDEALMKSVVKGREAAFNELYRRYGDRMYRYFYRMLYQESALAHDFTQNLFLKIIERPDAFNPKYKFSTWFFTVAHNMCKNEYRRRSRLPDFQTLPEDFNATDSTFKLEQEQEKAILAQAINQLSPNHRDCFVLRYQQELEVKTISEILDCPEGTIKSRLFYASKKLAETLKPILKRD
ncbi:MAG: RNA polymerase sigma factor [Bacteroidota bacterium]